MHTASLKPLAFPFYVVRALIASFYRNKKFLNKNLQIKNKVIYLYH
jgi:hypothetical protein